MRYLSRMHSTSIRFGTLQTSLGTLLLAARDERVVHISLGDSAAALVDDLGHRERHRPVPLREAAADDLLHGWIRQLGSHLDDGAALPPLPLAMTGTAFQQRVWDALRGVPAGQTVTYGALAQAVGRPGAVRAVGAACGANRIAVLIPCHRAIRADGTLGGFRWGLERKQALLDRERHAG